jgi:uncharacterized protein (DUF1501 family)
MRTVGDIYPSRRDLLKFGGLGLAGAAAQGVWPLHAAASGSKVTPRGNARNVIFFELSGAISHVEGWDFKETAGTPKDLDMRPVARDLYMSQLLFPRLSKHMSKFAIVRSLLSHEEVHFRGQYYLQTGRQLNLAFAKEIPSVGSVIGMELEARRREKDTFPTYLSLNLDKGAAGALAAGFLPPRFSVVDINPESAVKGGALDDKAVQLLEERWRLLKALRDTDRSRAPGLGRDMAGYLDYYDTAHRLLTDDRWPASFRLAEADKQRYGNTSVGVSAMLARNVLAQDAGTHYVHICHPGWDHHVQIWDRSAPSHHYKLCEELDPALSSLMEDLAATPSKTNPTQTLLDETLVVVMGEFGRTPGALNNMGGRDHHNKCFPALFAGAGVAAGRIIGRSDKDGVTCAETGWHRKEQPRIENVVASVYSALGIDWTKEIRNTPSGRAFTFVDPLGPNGYIPTDEISALYA